MSHHEGRGKETRVVVCAEGVPDAVADDGAQPTGRPRYHEQDPVQVGSCSSSTNGPNASRQRCVLGPTPLASRLPLVGPEGRKVLQGSLVRA